MLLILLDDDGGTPPIPVLPLPPEYNGNHVAQAQNLLLEQFKNSDLLHALLESWTAQVQITEDLIAPLVVARDVDVATGATLDSLGEAVGAERSGLADGVYRLLIKAKVLVNSSSGTADELIAIVRQLANSPIGVLVDEYDPATVFIKPQDFAITENADVWGGLLQLAKAAGVRLVFVYSTVPTEAATWHFSAGATSDLGATYGFDNGKLAGAIT